MSMKRLLLAVAAVTILYGAYQLSREHSPTTVVSRQLLYGDFLNTLNDARTIKVEDFESSATMIRANAQWSIAERDGFAAKAGNIKRLLVQLGSLKILEEKTSKPENYGELGVEDLSTPEATSKLISVKDSDDNDMVSLLVGKGRIAKGNADRAYYVRKTNAAQALLVNGEISAETDPNSWLDPRIANIPIARVKKMLVKPASGDPIEIVKNSRDDRFFTLQNIPPGYEITSQASVSSLGGILGSLDFEDVIRRHQLTDATATATAVLETFDGLNVNMNVIPHDERAFVTFGFSYDENTVTATASPTESDDATGADDDEEIDVAAQATELSTKTEQWAYVIPQYKMRLLEKTFSDFIKPVEEKEESSADNDE